jgi:SAM-dependent methyltransferase
MGMLRRIQGAVDVVFGGSAIPQTICWGTLSQAELIIPWQTKNTRRWAHRWVRRHFQQLPLGRSDVVDAGSGTTNRLLDWYRPRVRRAYLLDFLVEPREEGNSSFVRADLDKGMPLPDCCADVVTSVSSVEHLSEAGQLLFFSEAARVLRPGGRVIMTLSYIFKIDESTQKILASNPSLAAAGFGHSARPNLRRMLEGAPELATPVAPKWADFPGFDGFSEDLIFADRDILTDPILSGGPDAVEVNALGKRYGEIGVYLVKK